MSDRPLSSGSPETWERRLRAAAAHFPYPATPDIAAGVKERLADRKKTASRRLAWAAVVAAVILAGLLAVPQVRAAVAAWLQIGAVRIFLIEPTPTPTPTAAPGATATARPSPSPTPLASVLELAGETTLAEARTAVPFPIRLSALPEALGPPDRVFVQNVMGGPMVVLVWLEPGQPDRAALSLHQLGPGAAASKTSPEVIRETTVNGRPAVWVSGPHLFQLQGDRYEARQLVAGNVLIWTEQEVTYRLEAGLGLDEARRMAESLR